MADEQPTSWRARLATGGAGVRLALRPGVSPGRIARAEQKIDLRFPSDLVNLLRETDGVIEERRVAGGWQPVRAAVWTCDEIEDVNADSDDDTDGPWFLLFAAGADGTMFAFAVDDSGEEDPSIYAYLPADERWQRVAASLADHLRAWTN